jgi:hypothetical protein
MSGASESGAVEKPMHRDRVAALGWAVNLELPISLRYDLKIVTGKEFCAANAEPLVIERTPRPIAVAVLEERKTVSG